MLDLLVAIFATWQLVEIIHHSALFAGVRARAETADNGVVRVLLCPFCLSVWIALFVVIFLADNAPILRVLVMAFAVSRGANLANDLTHGICRTPKPGTLLPPEPPAQNPPARDPDPIIQEIQK